MDTSTGRSLEARARAVLDRVLLLTVSKGRFPREAFVRDRNEDDRDVLVLLLEDGRYLARVSAGDGDGAWDPRLALTILGIYEAKTKEAKTEAQGIAETRRRLIRAHEKYANRMVPLGWIHKRYAEDLERVAFRRWCTTLCSPRLQGRYVWDATGFAGQADAQGRVSKDTGFFTHVRIEPSFVEWDVPKPKGRPPFLLADAALRVEVESRHVRVYGGPAELAIFPKQVGSLALEALVARPGRRLHTLDLKLHAEGFGRFIDSIAETPDEVAYFVEHFGIEFDTSRCDEKELARLAAVIRCIQMRFENYSGEDDPDSERAAHARSEYQGLLDDVGAALVAGPLKADYPLIKNATRVVGRALTAILRTKALVPFASCFDGNEFIEYRPPSAGKASRKRAPSR